jgi:hypothetical protein
VLRIFDAPTSQSYEVRFGKGHLGRDITAHLEHAFSGRQGEWRVSIAGSRVAESWDLRVEGRNGLERSYALSADAGKHEPATIRALVLKLVPPAKT